MATTYSVEQRAELASQAIDVIARQRAAGIGCEGISLAIAVLLGIDSAGESAYGTWSELAIAELIITVYKLAPDAHLDDIAASIESETEWIAGYERELDAGHDLERWRVVGAALRELAPEVFAEKVRELTAKVEAP